MPGLERRCSFHLSLKPPSSLLSLESPSSLRLNPELSSSLRPLDSGTASDHLGQRQAPQHKATELPLSQRGVDEVLIPKPRATELAPSQHGASELIATRSYRALRSQPRAAVLPPSQRGDDELTIPTWILRTPFIPAFSHRAPIVPA